MKEFVKNLIEQLEKLKSEVMAPADIVWNNAIKMCINETNRLEEEYNDGWIMGRNPTKEECNNWRKTFQATIYQGAGEELYTTTVVLQYEYTMVRGKEVSRWLFKDKISPWQPIAWKPLDEPYQLKK